MLPRLLFADTFYWVALLNPGDASHASVTSFGSRLVAARLLTTDEVLAELLNKFSRSGPHWRGTAASLVHDLCNDPDVDVLPQTPGEFNTSLALYEARPHKEYSLTDCRSMVAMRPLGLTEVLTNDRHFTQEGFTILFPTL
jgi:predicted nucleic acid-binding protein